MKAMSLEELTKEQLEELVRIYARNLLALDGVWFQSVERGRGMDEAMAHDCAVWRRFTETEARRIKTFLGLPERPGLDGLEQALAFRFAALANRRTECRRAGDALEFRVVDCRVQSARTRRGLPLHPCKPVGENEYAYFARVIDDRIGCEAVSCFPDMTEPDGACAWRYALRFGTFYVWRYRSMSSKKVRADRGK